ncbi:hypothetical protein J1614_008717 [Plenodomus biglobosus]|nr:hypothetical protein J1614_008717 [Plenodomus biglobosus]
MIVAVGPWGLKLEAVLEPLTIIPGHAHADLITSTAGGSDAVKYKLSPRSAELSEILILRHGDVICFARSAHSLICKWIASEVQVNSSAAETRAIELPTSNVNDETFEEDTEDEDLDEATEVAIATYRPKATPVPRLSNQISVVVQETPIADRIVGTMEFTSAHETNKYDPASTNDAVSSGVADSAEDEAETYTTAHTKDLPLVTMNDVDASVHAPIARSASAPAESADEKAPQRSPRVEIPQRASRKRDSPTTNDEDHDDDKRSIIRSNKRTKRDVDDQNDTQDSRMSNIDVDETKKSKTVVVAKGKKRKSEVSETRAESPPRSQRSSQRSNATVANGTPYEGPAPRVAVSNSSITKTSQAVKFLKKHGGSLIESTEEPFNILWSVHAFAVTFPS